MQVIQGNFRRPAPPWAGRRGLVEVLEAWRGGAVGPSLVLDRVLPARAAVFRPLPAALAPAVKRALEVRGLIALYSHQAQVFERVQAGEHVVVATPTASGKSLAYNLPVLDTFARSESARALYLFPTKALARDQEQALRSLLGEAGLAHGAVTYDGDTPGDARRTARDRAGVLITNPDMLHTGILPHHAAWGRFFSNLRYIVIDELHTYRGVFGAHLANVLRRLLRIAAFHGAAPRLLFSSATISNPAEHASLLSGQPVSLVDESGAPQGPRHVVCYDPPVINAELGLRASAIKSAVRLASDLIQAGVSTLIFGQSRNTVEVMLKYLRDALGDTALDSGQVQAYRGGYLADTRRRIEEGLKAGEVKGVVATNALELGIDIGALDAVINVGYPGTMAGLWQRFGRAGRRQEPSLGLMVATSAPLDQYFAREPELLLSAPVEEARIDPDNLEILLSHLKCAAFELPFEQGEAFGRVTPQAVGDALGFLTEHQVVQPVPGRSGKTVYHWSSDAYPASNVSLRSASFDNFVIIDVARTRTIAEMDFRSTHTMLHEQAIYQHEGEQYQVERLDYDNHKAYVRKVEPDYYTTALTHVRVSVLDEAKSEWLPARGAGVGGLGLHVGMGDVNVVEKVVGYKKIKFHTHENVGYGDVDLPAIEKPTTAFWLTIPEALLGVIDVPRGVMLDALRGLLSAMHAVAAVGLMMDPRDLGQTLVDEPGVGAPKGAGTDGRHFEPTMYLYDSVAGGAGLAPRLYEERETILHRAERLIAGCGCELGCPSCVGVVLGVSEPLHGKKALALRWLSVLGVGG